MKRLAAEELRELTRLVLSAALTFAVWIALGMRPGLIPFGDDVRELDWPAWVELLRVNGDLSRWSYRASYLGGARILELAGSPPFHSVAATLHLSAAHAIFLGAWMTQTMLGYLGVTAVNALLRSWESRELSWTNTAAVSLALAFMPLAGVRFYGGHLSVVAGYLAFAAPAALLLVLRAGRTPTLVQLTVIALAVQLTLSSGMQQMVLYAVVFGGILLAPLVARTLKSRAIPGLLALLAGVVLALPIFLVMLAASRSDDAARSLTGTTLTWSWTVSTLRDWATLFTAGGDLLRARADAPWEFHETQVPLGLALAGLILVPWARERGLRWSLPIGLILLVAFTMRIEPIASLMLRLVPPLRAFRVPARGIAPFAVLVTMLGAAGFVARSSSESREPHAYTRGLAGRLAAITVLTAMLVLPGPAGELVALVALVGFALAPHLAPQWFGPIALAVGSIAAVSRLLPTPVYERDLVAEVDTIRAEIPRRDHELDRVIVDRPTASSSGGLAAFGISTPFGYWFPTRRRLETHAAVHDIVLVSTQHAFMPNEGPKGASTRAVALLFNVRAWVHYGNDRRPQTLAPLPTIGPAWFPRRWVVVENLGAALRERAEPKFFRDDAVTLDPTVTPIDAGCEHGTATVTRIVDGGQRIELAVSSPARCVVVVAANLTTRHHATFNGAAIPLVPVNGTLLGALVPAGAGALVIDHVVPIPRWGFVGLLILALAFAASLALRAREGAESDAP